MLLHQITALPQTPELDFTGLLLRGEEGKGWGWEGVGEEGSGWPVFSLSRPVNPKLSTTHALVG